MRFLLFTVALAAGTELTVSNVGEQMNAILEKQISTLEQEGQQAAVVWAKESCECKGIVDAETERMTDRAEKMSSASAAKKEAQANYNESRDLMVEAEDERDDHMKNAADFEAEKRETVMTLSKSISDLQNGASLFQKAINVLKQGMSGNESEAGTAREDMERANAYEKDNEGRGKSNTIVDTLNDMMAKMKDLATKKRQDLADQERSLTSKITTENNSAQEQDNEAKQQRKLKNKEKSTLGAEQQKYTQFVATFVDSQKNLNAANDRCIAKRKAWKEASDERHGDLQEFHKMHYTMKHYVIAQISGADAAAEGASFLQVKHDAEDYAKAVSLVAVMPAVDVSGILSELQATGPLDKIEGLIKDKIEEMESDRKKKAEHAQKCNRELSIIKQRRDAAFENRNDAMAAFQSAKAREQECIQQVLDIETEHDEVKQDEHVQQRNRIIEHRYISKALEKSKNASNAIKGFVERAEDKGDKQSGNAGANDAMRDSLQMLLNDLYTHQDELEATDKTHQKSFDQLVQENKMGTAKRKTFHAEAKTCVTDKRAESEENYKSYLDAFKELDVALNEYDVKLNKECKVAGVSYEERVAAREAEIAGLKAALDALK